MSRSYCCMYFYSRLSYSKSGNRTETLKRPANGDQPFSKHSQNLWSSPTNAHVNDSHSEPVSELGTSNHNSSVSVRREGVRPRKSETNTLNSFAESNRKSAPRDKPPDTSRGIKSINAK